MPDKPTTAAGYRSDFTERVRATCLYIATKLGDLTDDIVIVGGLVPSLPIVGAAETHVGTMDLDIGLTIGLLDEGRYRTLTERLRRAGLTQDINDAGALTRQRWKIERPDRVTLDFLIPPSRPEDRGGRLRDIEADFAAVIAPGLHLAFRDRVAATLTGQTLVGEQASRTVWVCGPGAYVVLKALAFHLRGENKDAYDLFFVVQNHGNGVEDVAARLGELLDDPDARTALDILRRDFLDHEGLRTRGWPSS